MPYNPLASPLPTFYMHTSGKILQLKTSLALVFVYNQNKLYKSNDHDDHILG